MSNGLYIEGRNVRVYKYVGVSPLEIVCATDMALTINQELIGATTPDSGVYREVRPRLIDFTLSLSGVVTSDNDGNVSVFYMLNNIREVHDLSVVFTDNDGNERVFRADFYIENNTLNAPADNSAGYEMNLRGTGSYSLSELDEPVSGDNVTSDTFTISGGVVQNDDWIGLTDANIVEVAREGTELTSMGLSYTFDGVTGTITPDADTTIDGQKLFVIWTF